MSFPPLFKLRRFSSSDDRTMPLSLCSSWSREDATIRGCYDKPSQFVLICRLFTFDKTLLIHVGFSMCVLVKVCSYIRAAWLLTGQFFKNLKCGYTPHVTGESEYETWAERFFTFSTSFLLLGLDFISHELLSGFDLKLDPHTVQKNWTMFTFPFLSIITSCLWLRAGFLLRSQYD